jgi:ribosomal protein S18 acetylase RimI-like enzyme
MAQWPSGQTKCETRAVLIVRAAEPADAIEVARVHVRSWQRAYRGLLPNDYLDGLRAEDRAARYTFGRAGDDSAATIVALDGGAIQGFATIGPARGEADTKLGELLALYVDPSSWGLGVGRRLLGEARVRLTGRSFTEAILWVLAGNERAERLYRADGWIHDGARREEEIWGVRADEVRYRRSLP